jgi:hypothetical protein
LKLLDRLRALNFDDHEVYLLLVEHFEGNGGTNKSGLPELTFSLTDLPDEVYLTLRYKQNRITQLTPGRNFTKQRQDEFVERAACISIEDAGSFIVHRPLFSARPLKHQYQVGSILRLRPPPSETVYGQELCEMQATLSRFAVEQKVFQQPHPLVMEIRVRKSSSTLLQSYWMMRDLDRFQNAVTLLLAADIKYAHFPSGPLWISLFREKRMENHLVQTGFSYEYPDESSDFPVANDPVAALYSGTDYYERIWARDTELLLPLTLMWHIDLVRALNLEQANRFHRACMWFAQGVQFRSVETIGIPSCAAAIECLLPREPNIEKSFNQIVERYGKLTEGTRHLAMQLYDARSDLLHGSFAHDSDTGWASFKRDDDWQTLLIWVIARRVLIGWLEDESRI